MWTNVSTFTWGNRGCPTRTRGPYHQRQADKSSSLFSSADSDRCLVTRTTSSL
ncbi:hypothetical protein DPMN_135892 [Dreissena polymorpha]|uniref:Uncharacterized protein n=1 Tax=Dreissena polymorpha TaxID=45954 RepID=A0A9D4JH99_DREPO|nr:hypothetical protein DPMN_135892 [Dreissena polymorpha]